MATTKSTALHLALAVPEAMVIGLVESSDGGIEFRSNIDRLRASAAKVDAVLIGPGMVEEEDALQLAAGLCSNSACPLVLDAAVLCGLQEYATHVRTCNSPAIITPHAGEMAQLIGKTRTEIEAKPLDAAREAAGLLRAVVVMKGAVTHIVHPDGRSWVFKGGNVGLATSGSGDVLAGLLVGLLARGATPVTAALWGVYLHGEAGRRMAAKVGVIGYLARELSAEVPSFLPVG